MKRSLPIVAVALILLLLHTLRDPLNPSLYYPFLVVGDPQAQQVRFIQLGYADAPQCNRALTTLAIAVMNGCPSCKIFEKSCLAQLDETQRKWLGDSLLDWPSANMPNGTAVFTAPTDSKALAACQEGERLSQAGRPEFRIRCHPAGTPRLLGASQRTKLEDGKNARDQYFLLMAAIALAMAFLLLRAHLAHRRALAALGTRNLSPEQRVGLPRFHWTQKVTLAAIDALVLLLAAAVATLPKPRDTLAWLQFDKGILVIHLALVGIVVAWFWVGLEHYSRRRTMFDELREIGRVTFVALLLGAASVLAFGIDNVNYSMFAIWAMAFLLVPLGRTIGRDLLDDLGLWKTPVAIIGTGNTARDAAAALVSDDSLGYVPCFFIDPATNDSRVLEMHAWYDFDPAMSNGGSRENEASPVRGSMPELLAELANPIVVFALDQNADRDIATRLIGEVRSSSFYFHLIPPLRDVPLLDASLSPFLSHELALLTFKNNLLKRTSQWIKRIIDLAVSVPCILIFSPLMLFCAAVVSIISRSNPFYAQQREGFRGRLVSVWKLRSMYPNAEQLLADHLERDPEARQEWHSYFKLSNDPRILPYIGSFIRRTSIDELPQLFNVLVGNLSLVGPRPFPEYHLDSFSGEFRELRRAVKPGITGLWQISARSDGDLAIQEYFDSYYIRNWSLWLDIYILWRTIDAVIVGRGAR